MRRQDREITDRNELLQVIERCDVCRLGLNDDGYPYILPLNFGVEVRDGTVVFYFHGATEGHKYTLIERDPRASFEMDCDHEMFSVKERGYCTMNYSSVMGRGKVEIITDPDEKLHALTVMTDRYHTEHFEFHHGAIPRTTVMKLTVESMVGKCKQSKK